MQRLENAPTVIPVFLMYSECTRKRLTGMRNAAQ